MMSDLDLLDQYAPGESAAAILAPVLKAYAAANNGLEPADASQLAPYATTPEQQTALQKAIKRNGSP
jgi:hypothetical protein